MKLEVEVSVEEYNSLSKIVCLMNFLLPEKMPKCQEQVGHFFS